MQVKNVRVSNNGILLSNGTGVFEIGDEYNALSCGVFKQLPMEKMKYNISFKYMGTTFKYDMVCTIPGTYSKFIGPRTQNDPKEKTVPQGTSYNVTITDSGKWLHAPGTDFLFAFIMDDWDDGLKTKVTNVFEAALAMSSTIKEAVKKTSGQDVVNGLYLLDQGAMTQAMNSIDGMSATSTDQKNEQGSGKAVEINQEFFAAILAGLGGDVEPLMSYLTEEMGNVQAQTKNSTVTENFGTVIGLVSVMPVLNVPVTTFQYVYSSSATSSWFVKVNCGSYQTYSYNYDFAVVNYNYVKPEPEFLTK